MARREIPNIIIENARIGWLNFEGKAGRYNREGDKNFAVFLDEEVAKDMEREGWNIKFTKPREEDDVPTPYVNVAVMYASRRPPKITMITSRGEHILDESEVKMLDWADIQRVDLALRPYEWERPDGSTGIKAYLKSMYVTIEEDDLDRKYNSRD